MTNDEPRPLARHPQPVPSDVLSALEVAYSNGLDMTQRTTVIRVLTDLGEHWSAVVWLRDHPVGYVNALDLMAARLRPPRSWRRR